MDKYRKPRRTGQSLLEMVVVVSASAILLAGLGSVMYVAGQVAGAPTASAHRVEAARVLSVLADELRYATLITEQSDHVLEFVVADRDDDGAAERIRYEWGGAPGEPLLKSIGDGEPVAVIDTVHDFQATAATADVTATWTTTLESTEGQLIGTSVGSSSTTGVTADLWLARVIDPASFPSTVGGVSNSSATSWNATRARFYGRNLINPTAGSIYVQLRDAGSPNNRPTSQVLGQVHILETQISSSNAWNNAPFSPSIQGLSFGRKYSLAWEGDTATAGNHALLQTANSASGNVTRSINRGGSWETEAIEIYCQLYGTYVAPGPVYTVRRKIVPYVAIVLQTGVADHSRIDASVPLLNRPELLSSYWRLDADDFAADPTAIDLDGDGVDDWDTAGSTIQSRPVNNFTGTTIVDASCVSGAVLRINANRVSNQHGLLSARVDTAANGTWTLTLLAQQSDNVADTKTLKQVANLPSGVTVRFRVTVFRGEDPENSNQQLDWVNLHVNGADIGTFAYPRYSTSSSERYVSLANNGTGFGHVEVRASNAATVELED